MNTSDDMQIFLTYGDIALASSLILMVLMVSWRLRLHLTKTLLMAAPYSRAAELYRSHPSVGVCARAVV